MKVIICTSVLFSNRGMNSFALLLTQDRSTNCVTEHGITVKFKQAPLFIQYIGHFRCQCFILFSKITIFKALARLLSLVMNHAKLLSSPKILRPEAQYKDNGEKMF